MLSNVSTPLLGMVDTAVVGHLDRPHYLGAVALGALIFTFLYWGFGFLRMGTTGLAAQARGAGQADEVRAVLARALLLAIGLGVVLVLLQRPIGRAAFALFQGSSLVEAEAAVYVGVRIWSAPATLANYVLLGWLLALERAGLALVLQLVLNGTNAVLDVLLVPVLGWGVPGVALASVAAEYTALGVGVVLVLRLLPRLGGAWRRPLILEPAAFRRLVAVNRDLFIRTLCLIGGFAWFTNQGARLGDVVLAANAVLLQFQTLMAYALDGFAHAAEALVGRAVGARRRDELAAAVRTTTLWAAGTALLFSLAYAAGGLLLIHALTGIDEVRATAATFLPWVALMPVVSIWSYQLDGIFIGATRTGAMRNAMIVSLLLFLALTVVTVPALGSHGLWLAFTIFMGLRAVTLGVAYPALARSVG